MTTPAWICRASAGFNGRSATDISCIMPSGTWVLEPTLPDAVSNVLATCFRLRFCGPPTSTCTTTQYKSLTRAYIESQGYNIVANFGDQFSDLIGGYADRTFKLPNPMYYLP